MYCYSLVILACFIVASSAWSRPFYPVQRRAPMRMRYTRFAPAPIPQYRALAEPLKREDPEWQHQKRYYEDHDHHGQGRKSTSAVTGPVHTFVTEPFKHEKPERQRPKRGYEDYDHHGQGHKSTSGVTGPVHTFVKTDKNANYKWGVRHHVGNKYAS